jgi:TfoX/Sxy family transcriptional regulator of competence genes
LPFDEKLRDRMKLALEGIPKVKEKKFFNGAVFMVDGKLCISIRKSQVMFRIDPAIHDELIHKKGCQTMIMGKHEYIGYVLVDDDVLKTPKEVDYWVELALDFNKRAKASRKSK